MKTERQAHDALTDRRDYSPRIWFEAVEESAAPRAVPPMQCDCTLGLAACNCCGVDPRDSQLASDFAELQGEQIRRTDRLVNWLAVSLALAVAAWAVFA